MLRILERFKTNRPHYLQREIVVKVCEEAMQDYVLGTRSHPMVETTLLQSMGTQWGFLGTAGDVRARELFRKGELDRIQLGKYSYYWIKSPVWNEHSVSIYIENIKTKLRRG